MASRARNAMRVTHELGRRTGQDRAAYASLVHGSAAQARCEAGRSRLPLLRLTLRLAQDGLRKATYWSTSSGAMSRLGKKARLFRQKKLEQKRRHYRKLHEFQCGLCWICLRPIDMSIPKNDPMSATRDHLKPVARGGGGQPNNILLAHKMCNVRRAHRAIVTMGMAMERLQRATGNSPTEPA